MKGSKFNQEFARTLVIKFDDLNQDVNADVEYNMFTQNHFELMDWYWTAIEQEGKSTITSQEELEQYTEGVVRGRYGDHAFEMWSQERFPEEIETPDTNPAGEPTVMGSFDENGDTI